MGYDDGRRKSWPDPGVLMRIAIGEELFRAGSLGCEQPSRNGSLFEDRGASRVSGANEGQAISQEAPESFGDRGLEDDAFEDPSGIQEKRKFANSSE